MENQKDKKHLFLLKRGKQKQRLNSSLEFGSWMFKVKGASKQKKKVRLL